MSLNIKLDSFDVLSKEVDIDKSTVIRASAGSGKTTVIEHVVIRLLLGIGVSEQVLPGQILITSFSRNAVKEIQNRIFARLYSLLSLLRLNKIEEILEKFPYIDICDGQIDKHEEYTNLIGEAFSSIDTFQIYTLESLKESIVSSFIINKDSIKRLPSAYLTTIYEEDSRFEFTYILHKLSKDDRDHLESALSVFGGPENLYISPFDKFILGIDITDGCLSMALKNSFDELMKKLCLSIDSSHNAQSGFIIQKKYVCKAILSAVVVRRLMDTGHIFSNKKIKDVQETIDAGTGDFSNMSKYILIDEAQDLSNLDLDVIKIVASSSIFSPIFYVVGDEKQSLFGFRGSNIKILIDMSNNKVKGMNFDRSCSLIRSYRSSKKIIKFINTIFESRNIPEFEFITHESSIEQESEVGILFSSTDRMLDDLKFLINKHLLSNKGSFAIIADTNKMLCSIQDYFSSSYGLEFSRPSLGPVCASKILHVIFDSFKIDGSIYIHNKDAKYLAKHLFCYDELSEVKYEYLKAIIASWHTRVRLEGITGLVDGMLASDNIFFPGRSIGEILKDFDKVNICNDLYLVSSAIYENIEDIMANSVSFYGMSMHIKDMLYKLFSKVIDSSKNRIKSNFSEDKISLHTVHSSKGLEFDSVVYIYTPGNIPTDASYKSYVAMTRAKTNLCVLYLASNRKCYDVFDSLDDKYILKSGKVDDENALRNVGVFSDKKINLSLNIAENINIKKMSYISYSDLVDKSKNIDDVMFEIDHQEGALESSKEIGNLIHQLIDSYEISIGIDEDVLEMALSKKKINKENIIEVRELVSRCIDSKFISIDGDMYAITDVLVDTRFHVFRECKFHILEGDSKVILGIVDCCIFVKDSDRMIVVDWKTGMLPKDKSEDVMNKFTLSRYGIQRDLYVQAFFTMYSNIREIEFMFVYPRYKVSDCPVISRFVHVRE